MGMRRPRREELKRLEGKTLDARFRSIIRDGLNCSPFEAEAVLDVVKEVYGPYLAETPAASPPGRITLVAIAADEPAGKAVSECETRTISLTIHHGSRDDKLLQREGTAGFRRARIPELCQEALSQDALLTREDLAYRIFFVGVRTISRDLKILREENPVTPIPLRSTVHDIGPVLTHRVQIVRLALEGKTTTQICRIMHHSPQAVANYLSTFVRCAQLARRDMQVGQIAFLLRRGRGLMQRYLDLLQLCEEDKNLSYHLEELLSRGQGAGEKRTDRRSPDEQ
ncbi:MAG: DUF1670 domain-containing protein [Phycisphaerales bacterium]|nr:MAG: DUF1670 domain-containing protein [Phycisphaerales bacterium]